MTESTKILAQDISASHALTQEEMAFLFDSADVNAIILSDEEMVLTQGEGF